MAIPRTKSRPVLRVGIGGPVGSGKTALMDALCKRLRARFDIAAVTNDIYTREDAEFLIRSEALAPERIVGVETGGCPHTAIREDASINLDAVDGLSRKFPKLDLVIIESGGDNLAATFSPELADLCIYVIDVAGGDKIPRKGGPGITRSDLLVINKTDLAPHVDHVQAEVRQLGAERRGQVVAAALDDDQVQLRELARQAVHRVEVDRRVLADGGVRAAARLDADDALLRQRPAARQELRVLLGVDVVGHHRDVVAVTQALAQCIDQRGLARADGAGDADAERLQARHDRNNRL